MSRSLSSSSSSTSVSNLLSQWEHKGISSCVLGMSKIGKASNLTYKLSHAALLLLTKKIDYDEDDESEMTNEDGILIEYGDYEEEKSKVQKGLVVYHYGDKGGLRYYIKKYGEFIKEFGDIGYVDMNIHENNQTTFDVFINKVAKREDNKWIKKNYSVPFGFHCQTFAVEALKELKPYFKTSNVYPSDPNLAKKKSKQKMEFIPANIKEQLIKFHIKENN